MTMRESHAPYLKALLTNVGPILEGLGLKGLREGRGYKIACPWHSDRTPSCTVRIGPDGTTQVRCHGCGVGGDVFSLIAAVRGLSISTGFSEVLLEAARIAGDWHLVAELEGRGPTAERRPIVRPTPPPPEPSLDAEAYAAVAEALLELCPLRAQRDACEYLRGRCIFADAEARGVGALPPASSQGALFASMASRFGEDVLILAGLANDAGTAFRASAWRLLIPWRDRDGRVLSVQRRVLGKPPGDAPKYLFPRGRTMPREPYLAEFFDVCIQVSEMGRRKPTVVFVEGALDALAAIAWRRRDKRRGDSSIVLGIPSASAWRSDWAKYARGIDAVVAVDSDLAGDASAKRILDDLSAVAKSVRRGRPPGNFKDFGEALERGAA